MKRQLMKGVAGALALSTALSAGSAAATRASARAAQAPAALPRYAANANRPVIGQSATRAGATFTASETHEPAVLAANSAKLTLTGCVIRKTGPNAAVVAASPSLVTLNGCAITTDGRGASGAFAHGANSHIRIANSTIRTNAASEAGAACGVAAARDGRVALDNVNITTNGPRSPALATTVTGTGGTVVARGGTMTTSGAGSPVLRSAGHIQVYDVTGTARHPESHAAIVGGLSTVDAIDSDLTGPRGGVLFEPSAGTSTYTMTGGSLTALTGPAFDVRGTAAKISVRGGAAITAGSGVLVNVTDKGSLTMTLVGQPLTGDVRNTGGGPATLALKNGATLTGAITHAALELDSSSTWTATGPSTLTVLTGTISGIVGNGHDVYYDPALNEWLGGRAYGLSGGGTLKPVPMLPMLGFVCYLQLYGCNGLILSWMWRIGGGPESSPQQLFLYSRDWRQHRN
ncbi:MAG: hypothetical protein JO345_39285 [Streptosporangiaceae bacterium]|nr:hypothetical protein [Streptosporangiaceae bacterium]